MFGQLVFLTKTCSTIAAFVRLNKLDATPNALFAIFDNVLTMPFALFMSMWSTIYIEFWKRANQYYAYRWNMNDYERVELPRTEFRATKARFSAVTGKRELYYPMYWKALRYLFSALAVIAAVSSRIGARMQLIHCSNSLAIVLRCLLLLDQLHV